MGDERQKDTNEAYLSGYDAIWGKKDDPPKPASTLEELLTEANKKEKG